MGANSRLGAYSNKYGSHFLAPGFAQRTKEREASGSRPLFIFWYLVFVREGRRVSTSRAEKVFMS